MGLAQGRNECPATAAVISTSDRAGVNLGPRPLDGAEGGRIFE